MGKSNERTGFGGLIETVWESIEHDLMGSDRPARCPHRIGAARTVLGRSEFGQMCAQVARLEPIQMARAWCRQRGIEVDQIRQIAVLPPLPPRGNPLEEWRLGRGATVAEASRLFGTAESTWRSWEQRTRAPEMPELLRFATAIGADPAVLDAWFRDGRVRAELGRRRGAIVEQDLRYRWLDGPGLRFRALRARMGWGLKELAAAIGVSHAAPHLWEIGASKPRPEMVARVERLEEHA